ncbi:hypothetical protein PV318_00075 [Streptomyces sp. ME02-6991-2B]|nr:hypothetical protein [Streptomyces sp. ME02-6991-2B]
MDQTAGELEQLSAENTQEELARVRARYAQSWQTRFIDLLEDLPEEEREAAAAELRSLVDHVQQQASRPGASAQTGGIAVAGDVNISATHGSMAAGVVHGGMHMGPPQPGAERG